MIETGKNFGNRTLKNRKFNLERMKRFLRLFCEFEEIISKIFSFSKMNFLETVNEDLVSRFGKSFGNRTLKNRRFNSERMKRFLLLRI